MKIDLRLTKKKIGYSLIASLIVYIVFSAFQVITKKTNFREYMSPEWFKVYHLLLILAFIITYFFISWLVMHKSPNTLKIIKTK